MCIIGIDLGVTAKHRAIIADDRAQFLSPIIKLRTRMEDLDRLLARARQGTDPVTPLLSPSRYSTGTRSPTY